MSYEYEFYAPDSQEEVIATASTDAPLPHIQVGHSLLIETPSYSTKIGAILVIHHVEVYLFWNKFRQQTKQKVHVFLRERERTQLLRTQEA